MTAPGEARRVLAELEPPLPPPALYDLQLISSELVTNSLRHAGLVGSDTIAFRVQVIDHTVRVEVEDPANAFDPVIARRRPELGPGGWGLYIVARVATRWGKVPNDGLWAEVDLARPR